MSQASSDAVLAARERYRAANRLSEAATVEAARNLPGGNTRTVLYHAPFPLRFDKGVGCELIDVDGHRYLDFLGEYTAGICGHSHPLIHQAVARALDLGLSMGGHHVAEPRFAAAVCERFGLELVRFTNSGTEANLMAIGAARAFTGRDALIAIDGGYHGGVLSFDHGRSSVNAPFDVTLCGFNDLASFESAFAALDDRVAAVILEPMLGSGGCIAATPAFLDGVVSLAHAHGALVIFDQVMTSRVGRRGLAADYGIQPDLMTLGKYLGGGFSVGAFGGRRDVMELFDPARPGAIGHAGTFNNNTMTMTVGLTAITEIYTEDEAARLSALGDEFRSRMNDAFAGRGLPFVVSGRGSMNVLHPQPVAPTRPAELTGDSALRELVFLGLLERGIYIAPRGMINLSVVHGLDHLETLANGLLDVCESLRDLTLGDQRTR